MFDFYFGTADDIRADPRSFLLAVKRMLPRWANSLPDSEFLALIDLIDGQDRTAPPVFVETGVGASTILFVHYAMLYGGRLVSWDTNPSKGSFIRSVCGETVGAHHRKAVTDCWTFIGTSSLAPHTGMPILHELVDRVDLSLHDSDHTWKTIGGEVACVIPHLRNGSIVCVDDANQDYLHTYEPIINVTRRKIGLSSVPPIADNRCAPHHENAEMLLSDHFAAVDRVDHTFQEYLKDDLFYAWYRADRTNMAAVGMERLAEIENRFVAWRVANRKAQPGHQIR